MSDIIDRFKRGAVGTAPPPPTPEPTPPAPYIKKPLTTKQKTRHTPTKTEEPVTAQRLIVETKIQNVFTARDYLKFRSSIVPESTYQIPMLGGKEVTQADIEKYKKDTGQPDYIPQYHIVTGQTILSDMEEQYREGRKSQKDFRQAVSELDPRTQLIKTDEGYSVLPPPSQFKLITERFAKKPVWEQKAIELTSGIVQLPASFINLLGGGQPYKTWKDPKTGRVYRVETLNIGYSPVDTYIDPYTGHRYSKKDDKFQRVKSGFIDFAEMTHKMPTLIDVPMSWIPSNVPLFGSTAETEQRARWVHRRVQQDPTSLITMGISEGVAMFGFSQVLKPAGTFVSPYIGKGTSFVSSKMGKYITSPTMKYLKTGFKSNMFRSSRYTPQSIQNMYKNLFGKVTPHSFTTGRATVSTMLSPTTRYTYVVGSKPLQLQGGIISRLMYYSPKRMGLSGISTRPLIGSRIITARSRISGISWGGKDPLKGWGRFKGGSYDASTLFRRAFPWSKGGNIYLAPRWISQKGISELQKAGTASSKYLFMSKGKNFLFSGLKTTVEKPTGVLSKRFNVLEKGFALGYKNIDDWIPAIMKKLPSGIDHSFFGMGTITKTPIRSVLSIIDRTPPASSLMRGTTGTTQLRGFQPNAKVVSQRYLDWLDFLEPSYKPVSILSTHRPKFFLKPSMPPKDDVIRTLLSGGAVAGKRIDLSTTVVKDFLKGDDILSKYKTDSVLDRYGTMKLTMQGNITDNLQDAGNLTMKMMLQGTAQKQALAQKQIKAVKTQTTDVYRFTQKPHMPMLPFWLPSGLYGRGKMFYGDELWGLKYKERRIKIPYKKVQKQLIKNLLGG